MLSTEVCRERVCTCVTVVNCAFGGENSTHTSVHHDGIALCCQGELIIWGLPLVEVLIEPLLAVLKGLGMDNVHKPDEKVSVLQQKVEMGKDQLRVPGRRERGTGERMREDRGRNEERREEGKGGVK